MHEEFFSRLFHGSKQSHVWFHVDLINLHFLIPNERFTSHVNHDCKYRVGNNVAEWEWEKLLFFGNWLSMLRCMKFNSIGELTLSTTAWSKRRAKENSKNSESLLFCSICHATLQKHLRTIAIKAVQMKHTISINKLKQCCSISWRSADQFSTFLSLECANKPIDWKYLSLNFVYAT